MRLYLVTVFLFLAAVPGSDGDNLDPICAKITNLISPFLTKPQIKTVINKVFDLAWSGKTIDEIQKQLLPIIMDVLTSQQNTDALKVYSSMSNELGGSSKAEELLNLLISKLTVALNPYIKKITTTIKTKKSKGKAKVQKAVYKQGAKFLVQANVQTAIDQVKKAFTQKQCDCAFKYLAPKYVKLGVYKFNSSPCTGTGN